MKKTAFVLLSCVILTLALSGCSKKEDQTTSTSDTTTQDSVMTSTETVTETTTSSINDTTNASGEKTTDSNGSDEYPEDGGGNPGVSNATELSVTVSEDKYFVDNHEISFDDLVEKISALSENSYVKLYDEKSTLKAFNKIKDYLEENGILYEIE